MPILAEKRQLVSCRGRIVLQPHRSLLQRIVDGQKLAKGIVELWGRSQYDGEGPRAPGFANFELAAGSGKVRTPMFY
jgi:hypothetical protein